MGGQWAEALKWRPGPGKELNEALQSPLPPCLSQACPASVFAVKESSRSDRPLDRPQFPYLATPGLSSSMQPGPRQLLALALGREAGVKGKDSGASLPRFQAHIWPFWLCDPGQVTALCLSFSCCKVAPSSQG